MVANYLTLLQVRQYAPSTLGAIAGTLKSFCLLLPQPHRDRITADFARTTPEDIDTYMQAAADQGLAPATINNALVKLRCFFTSNSHFALTVDSRWLMAVNLASSGIPLASRRPR